MALAFCLQTYATEKNRGDAQAALELCKLISDIEPAPRQDCYFMLVYRKDTPSVMVNGCVSALATKFKVDAFKAKNFATGHPHGSNMLWVSAMTEISALAKDKKRFPYTGVLTFEADCVPLRKDWISALTNEWNARVVLAGDWDEDSEDPDKGRTLGWPKYEVMGHADKEHINGNMILRPDILTRHPRLYKFTTDWGWDHINGAYFLRIGLDTDLIRQDYKRGTIYREQIPHITKNGIVPALYHGVQDEVGVDARKFMREILVDGVTVKSPAGDVPIPSAP